MSATLATLALAHGPGGWGPGPGFGWIGFVAPLVWLLTLVLIFGVLFAIFGRRWRQSAAERHAASRPVSASRQAEATLAQRFANGDIDETEYRARLEVIRTNATP